MKIYIAFVLLLAAPAELRRHNKDLFGLDDLLSGNYNTHRHRPIKPTSYDQGDENDGNDQDSSFLYDNEKISSSQKKILDENDGRSDESESADTSKRLKLTNHIQDNVPDKSSCIDKYDVRPEQLVKVKELTNGARMIRYDIIDKRTLPSNLNVQDSCMMNCCDQPICDLAMLSEKPTQEGFKCYLFTCNGSCPLTSHGDYKVMVSKKDSVLYTKSVIISSTPESTSIATYVNFSHQRSYLREISVVLLLIFGLLFTIFLFILLWCYCRKARNMGRNSKNYSVDADYLINGLYL